LKCKEVDKTFGGDTQFHICIKTVVCCSVLFYVAVTEFVERGMTESEASLGEMYYNM